MSLTPLNPTYGTDAFINILFNKTNEIVGQLNNNSSNYKVYTALLSQTGGDNPESFTNGSLSIGRTYEITDYQSGDDFTNVGAPLNANGVKFVATGDTPLVWTNSSELSWNYGAPTVTALENTLGGDLTWGYSALGGYTINSVNNLFTPNKTLANLTLWADDAVSPRTGIVSWSDSNTLYLSVIDSSGTPSDTIGNSNDPITFLTSIEIRVYN